MKTTIEVERAYIEELKFYTDRLIELEDGTNDIEFRFAVRPLLNYLEALQDKIKE